MNFKLKLDLRYKAGILILFIFTNILAGVLLIYVMKPFWMWFCIGIVIVSGFCTLFLFVIHFLVEHIQFISQPEMAKKIIELETELNRLKLNEPKEKKDVKE